MKNLLLIILSTILLIACTKDEKEGEGFVVATSIDVNFINSNGEDLLNAATTNHLSFDSMKLYYQFNEGIIEVYNVNMSAPRNIMLITETSPNFLRIVTNTNEEDLISNMDGIKIGESISYLKLNNFDTDTIRSRWRISNLSQVNSEIWYNGILVSNPQFEFEVIK